MEMQANGTGGKQIKGGYLLRYKKQFLWNRWSEEWVILYDDSTMAWFTEPGRSSPSGKILVKEAPEMLAIAHWTGQIPRRPPLPDGVSVSQLIALGSQRKRSKVYWMLAKSEQEVSDWVDAISKTLPPPPQIELVVDKPHLMNVLRRPLVRIRPATNSEVKQRKSATQSRRRHHRSASASTSTSASVAETTHCLMYNQNPLVKSDAAVAILSKKADAKASLACALPWGHGWGWATLPNGVWSGGLTWSQCEDTFTLHALPTTHCTNLIDTSCSGAVYHTDIGGFDFHSSGVDDLGGEDFDYAMDCGDFIF
ncbi:CG11000 [Drosophila busckii]|uniref:CG11000 n=2 Tax=Drosophila busckii TaxID=30019 RepID=A0A0M3QXL0_DROBS|nr:CG11000 [Drosophila busckii]